MAKSIRTHLTKAEAAEFDAITPLLTQMHKDFQELARKKQDGGVGPTRIAMINRLLARAQKALRNEPSFDLLDLLDEALVPQNADAMLIIGQYVAALRAVAEKYKEDGYDNVKTWRIGG